MPDFRTALADGRVYVFDGAYGTLFQHRGLPAGLSPELFGLERPDVVRQAHDDYLAAGADILTTNTFGGSAPKLEGRTDVAAFNRAMAGIARQAADQHTARSGRPAFVAGSVGPTGLFVEPLGPLTFRELVDIFKEQIRGLVQGGADVIKAETHFDLAEAKAVVVAARQVCDLPVMVSMTFEGMASLTGTPPETFLDTMQNLGVEAVAINCGAGPEQMAELVRRFGPRLATPYHVQPNAGLPELVDGRTVFRLGPDAFAQACAVFAGPGGLGAKCIGGCCGAGPEHIAALARMVRAADGGVWHRPQATEPPAMALTSRARSVLLGPGRPLAIIGERINPTGKKVLTEEFQAGQHALALRFAEEQLEAGAAILDVNVGAPMVDETVLLPALAKALAERCQAPLALDSNDIQALEAALWTMPASPLVNSISGEPGRMEALGPLCKAMGAPFILLPLKGRKLPVTGAERIAIIEELLAQADALGIPRRLVMVDALALTVSSKPEAARASLEVIRHCTEVLGLPTAIGLSNISFGLPARELVNSTFLAMCMAAGMAACIANPSSVRLREARCAAEVLLGRDPAAEGFIAGFSGWTPGSGGEAAVAAAPKARVETLRQAVVAGAKDAILPMVEAALDQGQSPFAVVNEQLIPGIMEVGEKYERREYYLPQLMLSAETMQLGFERLKPLLEDDAAAGAKPRIVMATVEGDIHDIGKNIVCLLLKNHGFEVIDLGKDVPAGQIVSAAREQRAAVIGLSALMTTTMVRMEEVVKLVRREGLAARVMVGGAVVTEAYADRIGADGYAADAVAAAKLAKRLAEA